MRSSSQATGVSHRVGQIIKNQLNFWNVATFCVVDSATMAKPRMAYFGNGFVEIFHFAFEHCH